MIRIIDEPVFEMTQQEYDRMLQQYVYAKPVQLQEFVDCKLTFEQWLQAKGWPHTRQGRIKP